MKAGRSEIGAAIWGLTGPIMVSPRRLGDGAWQREAAGRWRAAPLPTSRGDTG